MVRRTPGLDERTSRSASVNNTNPCCRGIVRNRGDGLLQLSVTTAKPRGSAGNKTRPGIVMGRAAEVAFKNRPNKDDQPMTTNTRIGLVSAAVVSLSLALAPAAFAQDKMGKDDGMKKDSMSKDSMSKDAMKKDDGMKKDAMKKDDGMAKDGMKKDDGMKKN
jgi:pentapeptide MXKDX repeat protein